MTHSLVIAAFAFSTSPWLTARQPQPPSPSPTPPTKAQPAPKPAPPTPPSAAMPLEITGSIVDTAKASAAPANRVITNGKDWAALQLAWGIKDPPRVDFGKQLLVVGTSRSDKLTIETDLSADGDLRIRVLDNDDLRGGFRYRVRAVDKAGVTTVNGVSLAKVEEATAPPAVRAPGRPVPAAPPPVKPVPIPTPPAPPTAPPRVPPR